MDKTGKAILTAVLLATVVVGVIVGSLTIHPAKPLYVAVFTAILLAVSTSIGIPAGYAGTRRRARHRRTDPS